MVLLDPWSSFQVSMLPGLNAATSSSFGLESARNLACWGQGSALAEFSRAREKTAYKASHRAVGRVLGVGVALPAAGFDQRGKVLCAVPWSHEHGQAAWLQASSFTHSTSFSLNLSPKRYYY